MQRNIFHTSDPIAILDNLLSDLQFPRQLKRLPGVHQPEVKVYRPRSDQILAKETVEIRVRWEKEVQGGLMRCGANFPLGVLETQILSRAALKERLETWFKQVLYHAAEVPAG